MIVIEKKILAHLSQDHILRNLIEKVTLKDRPRQPSVFEALLRSIVFQQLSGASASAIHQRFISLFSGAFPDPVQLLRFTDEELRSAGLSRQKIEYLRNTARFFLENQLLHVNWERLADEEMIHELTKIKGVGRWTVEMILMFTLERSDVLPLDDLVIRQGMVELYQVGDLKGKVLTRKLTEIAEPWRPFRTVACRYIWQYKDTVI